MRVGEDSDRSSVRVVQSTEERFRLQRRGHRGRNGWTVRWYWRLPLDALMGARRVVILADVFRQHPLEMPFVERDEMVK